MPSLEPLLSRVIAISVTAGQAILDIYRQPALWEQTSKSDDSPLTAADLVSHRLILRELRLLTPDIPVLSEEGDSGIDRKLLSLLWLVDPLDGTREFVDRCDEFTVNIALVRSGKPVLGVVHVPVSGVTYAALTGAGAWRYVSGVREPVRSRKQGARATVWMSRRHQSGPELAFLGRAERQLGPVEVRQGGSALKMCLIAEGLGDVYPRFGPTMEWDTAAAQILLEEAGGALVDLHGEALRYNERDTLVNPSFLVLGDTARKQDWLGVLS